MLNKEGMERVTAPLAPPSVTVIWLEVPVKALSKEREAVLPIVTKGILELVLLALPVMLPQENWPAEY